MKERKLTVDMLRQMPAKEVKELLSGLSTAQLDELKHDYMFLARDNQLEPDGDDWNTWFLNCGRGFGKLLDKNTPVLTTKGWKTVGEVGVGDFIYDENGIPTQVVKTFDATPKKSYRLHFSDGSYVDCCDEHQWTTWEHKDRKAFNRSQYEDSPLPEDWPNWTPKKKVGSKRVSRERIAECLELHKKGYSERKISAITGVARNSMRPHLAAGEYVEKALTETIREVDFRVRTTQEIVDTFTHGVRGDINHSIPVSKPLKLPEENLLVDPYLFGYWLGDGTARNSGFTCGEEDQNHLKSEITKAGYSWTKPKASLSVTALGLITDLKAIGAENKEVPNQYWFGSVDQRLALLQGLMDSDGCANKANVEFTAKRKEHADLVLWLARSLGQKPVMAAGRAILNGVDFGPKYTVTWTPIWNINPFRLARKAEKVRQNVSSKSYHRYIVSYEEIEAVPMRCFTVDSPNSLFLIGESLIPTHNTWTGVQWVREQVKLGKKRILAVAATNSDILRVMVQGESGFLALCHKNDRTYKGDLMGYPVWSPTKRTLTWENGAKVEFYSAEEPERLRGPQGECAWCDELAAWTKDVETWDMLQFCLRLGKHPRVCVTTTPKATKLVRDLLSSPKTVVTRGTTFDNTANLADTYLTAVKEQYEGTSLGRQELYAEVLMENAGALWTGDMINACQIKREDVPELSKIVVSLDPATTSNVESDLTGIIVAGLDENDTAYILEDHTFKGLPEAWASKAIELYHRWNANYIVYEKNQGGDLIPTVIKNIDADVPLKGVFASNAKIARAEPVSLLYEKGRVKHVTDPEFGQSLGELEIQMTTFEPMGKHKSPDRYDAMVWAVTELLLKGRAKPTLRMASV